jgi:hypothetical protein
MNRFVIASTLALVACGPASNTNGDMAQAPAADLTMGAGDLAKPPAMDVTLPMPASGFQLQTDKADVPMGREWQACFFFKVPDLNKGQPFYVNKVTMAQNVGSHHLNVFRQGTVLAPDPMNANIGLKGPNPDGTGSVVSWDGKGPCFYSANWADWPLVTNDQDAALDNNGMQVNYVMDLSQNPKGDNIAYKFTPGEILMVQSHFVNATTQVTPAKAYAIANFDMTMNTANIQEVGTLFATKQSIAICKNDPTPKFSGYCKLGGPSPITIIAANGHFHSRGTDFQMHMWDGTSIDPAAGMKFYESMTWNEPPMTTGLSLAVPNGGGVTWTCAYQWAPSPACADGCSCIKEPAGKTAADCCYGFGGVVEISEHCNAFVYYYPRIANKGDINCM